MSEDVWFVIGLCTAGHSLMDGMCPYCVSQSQKASLDPTSPSYIQVPRTLANRDYRLVYDLSDTLYSIPSPSHSSLSLLGSVDRIRDPRSG